jgi:hypothetical protein
VGFVSGGWSGRSFQEDRRGWSFEGGRVGSSARRPHTHVRLSRLCGPFSLHVRCPTVPVENKGVEDAARMATNGVEGLNQG